ncbi:hypothetical protein AMTR_s00012p00262780 [Amborella trichopoda]|uniref:Uncharacterized protein n=1 Tax=Amborella trichopoda TaxID=13333 RepID=W1PJY7_AMBTC|nr:hypothetical protein AMTR_s00012p00262780 [Amborella trichopoda]
MGTSGMMSCKRFGSPMGSLGGSLRYDVMWVVQIGSPMSGMGGSLRYDVMWVVRFTVQNPMELAGVYDVMRVTKSTVYDVMRATGVGVMRAVHCSESAVYDVMSAVYDVMRATCWCHAGGSLLKIGRL